MRFGRELSSRILSCRLLKYKRRRHSPVHNDQLFKSLQLKSPWQFRPTTRNSDGLLPAHAALSGHPLPANHTLLPRPATALLLLLLLLSCFLLHVQQHSY